jgi:hypothetical protein
MTTDNPTYLISTKGAQLAWPVSRGCLLPLGTWSYLRICRGYVLPYTRFCHIASFLDISLEFDVYSKLTTQLYDIRDDFNYLHLHTVFISRSLFDIQKLALHTICFLFEAVTNKPVDVTGVSTISFTCSFPHISRSLQRSSLPIQHSCKSNDMSHVSYQSLSHFRHFDLDYDSHRLPDLEFGLTACVTGLQGIFIPSRHHMPPLIYMYPTGLLGSITVLYLFNYIRAKKKKTTLLSK